MTVKQTQLLLSYFGFDLGAVDGVWGSRSAAACRRFQESRGLNADGTPGAETCRALLDAFTQEAERCEDAPAQESGDIPGFWQSIRYFRRDEPYIACPCGQCGGFPAKPTEKLMRLADAVRLAAGRPMVPTSTVRCAAHNARVGGVANSRHLTGNAMDFSVPGLTAAQLLPIVRAQGAAYAYAIDDTHVHMDVTE